jgi:hypothetical protein
LTDLALLGNRALRIAIRRNLVSFPSQIPVFGRFPRRETQWRLATLYFVFGWPARRIADRYGLTRERCGQIITEWRIRAVNMGYVQDVTPDGIEESTLIADAEAPLTLSAAVSPLALAGRDEIMRHRKWSAKQPARSPETQSGPSSSLS